MSVFDVSAGLYSLVRGGTSRESHRAPGTRPAEDYVLDEFFRENRGAINIVNVQYQNPLTIDLDLLQAAATIGTAFVAVGTLLLTGPAMRKKLLAEARKAQADAETSERSLAAAVAEAAASQDLSSREARWDPEPRAAWADVALMLSPLNKDEQRILEFLADNELLNGRIKYLRDSGFLIVERPMDEKEG